MLVETTMPRAAHWFEGLDGHRFISLTTFRQNGEAVPTPVTFAIRDGKLYIITGRTSGAVKRLQHNAHVQVAPCDPRGNTLGEAMGTQARILSDEEGERIRRLIKLRAPTPLMFLFNRIRDLRQGGNVYLEIEM